MLISFVSQTVAFEFFMNQTSSQNVNTHQTMNQHSHHKMSSDDVKSGEMKKDCCHGDECLMSTCHAFMAMPNFNLPTTERIAEQVIVANNFYSSFTAPSLYRPPIAA